MRVALYKYTSESKRAIAQHHASCDLRRLRREGVVCGYRHVVEDDYVGYEVWKE